MYSICILVFPERRDKKNILFYYNIECNTLEYRRLIMCIKKLNI